MTNNYYEDDYMIVKEVIGDIKTNSKNNVKRVQLVIWKNKKSDIAELDLRRYSLTEEKYLKGISFKGIEIRDLLKLIDENRKLLEEII